ncbi:uncharacterized protein LOC131994065 [Stomoxys calcitrans]|uniref:uncharacterized protein LOC131994065 n=1 Tax=Stomoxys calcitrans TaxID=35570 RepID=UPI0027E32939|nr:uncharacterized protein LOC131994065 [Stomoxys calcitrans]
MRDFRNGLNDFRELEENEPATPYSSRSTPYNRNFTPYIHASSKSLSGHISQQTLVGYNGHYEGDNSMFDEKSSLALDTSYEEDSDNSINNATKSDGYNANLDVNESPRMEEKSPRTLLQESQVWNVMTIYVLRFLPPQIMEIMTKFIILVYNSARKGFLYKACKFLRTMIVWLYHLLAVIATKIGSVSLWIFRIHYACRCLLWSLTWTKHGDLIFFLQILWRTPLVCFMAAVGLLLWLYDSVKQLLIAATANLLKAI